MTIDSGTASSIVAVLGSLAVMFGWGDYVPFIGTLVQAIIALITVVTGAYSVYSHTQKVAVTP